MSIVAVNVLNIQLLIKHDIQPLTFIIKDYFKIFNPMYQGNGGLFILLATTRTKSCLNGLNILARLMISYREPSINRGFITG